MADWLKVEKETPEKHEIWQLVGLLKISQAEVFLACFKFWRWADSNLTDGIAPRMSDLAVDEIVGIKGFGSALTIAGWAKFDNGNLVIPDFKKHMSESAKKRALENKRKEEYRSKNGSVPFLSQDCPKKRGTKSAREGDGEGEEEIDIHSRSADRCHSPKRISYEQKPENFDLSDVDWSVVAYRAISAARRVPPRTDADRRNFLRYAVLSCTAFSESWLSDAAEAVALAKERKRSRQSHYVAVLKSKAMELGVSVEDFNAMARRIEIPDEIWRSEVLRVE